MNASYQIVTLLTNKDFEIIPKFSFGDMDHEIIGKKDKITYIARICDTHLKDNRFNLSVQHIIKKDGIIIDQQATNYIRDTVKEYEEYGPRVANDLKFMLYRNNVL